MDNSTKQPTTQSLLLSQGLESKQSPTLPISFIEAEKLRGVICPNCGAMLEARKCKLNCTRRGCGYVVTCSEW